jgi:glycogen operon protein
LPYASINFITCHDGFTLTDLVSYDRKHNEANGENNRDGSDDNLSWNCGSEGPSEDAAIRALRERQKRNLIATLLLSQGVPMICGGAELSHTQHGNNNAYCQDNETTWLNWQLNEGQQQFLDFVRMVTKIWHQQPVFQRRKFFLGRKIRGSDIKDISWIDPSGEEMSDKAWAAGFVRCLGVRLAGDLIEDVDERGEPVVGDTLLLLLNAHHETIPFTLPAPKLEHHWECVFDTASEQVDPLAYPGGQKYGLQGRSLAVLRTRLPEETGQVIAAPQFETLRRENRSLGESGSRPVLGSVP